MNKINEAKVTQINAAVVAPTAPAESEKRRAPPPHEAKMLQQ